MKVEDGFPPLYAPTIWPAIDLVFFQSHRLTNQNNSAAVCAVCDAYIVLRIIRPTPQETPQIQDLHCNPWFLKSFLGCTTADSKTAVIGAAGDSFIDSSYIAENPPVGF